MLNLTDGKEKRPSKLNFDEWEELAADPQVVACLALVKLPIQALNWKVFCAAEKDQTNKPITTFVEETLGDVWDALIADMLMAMDFGFATLEKRWYQDSQGFWKWKTFLPVNPRQVEILRKGNEFNGFKQKGNENPVPADKAFIFTNDKSQVFGNLYGRPRSYGSYNPAWLKRHILRFAAVYYEQSSQPTKEGRAPALAEKVNPDGTSTQIDGLKYLYDEIISKITVGKTGYVLDSARDENGQYIWDVVNKELRKTGADYVDFARYLDVMIGRGAVVPDLTMFQNMETGSRAMSESHGEIFWTLECGSLTAIRRHVKQYAIDQLIRYNFGPDAPRATWEYEPLSPTTVQWLKGVVDRKIASGEATVDTDELATRLGIGINKTIAKPTPTTKPTNIPQDGADNKPKLEYEAKYPQGQMFLW